MWHFALKTHSCGTCLSSHPYPNKTASKNSRLVDEDLSCFNDQYENHIQAPLEVAINCADVILL